MFRLLTKIAIVGAGIAGLAAAHQLRHRAKITIFEKSWRAGGRLTTRLKDYVFDHGAQHFYVKTDAFRQFLAPYIEQGLVQRWDARFVEFDRDQIVARRQWNDGFPHYVAVPGMTDFGQTLARDFDVEYKTRVSAMEKHDNCWHLSSAEGSLGEYDWVILAIPAPQAAELLPSWIQFAQQVEQVKMQACYSLMLGFNSPLKLEFDAALVKNADISWISVDSSKPGRPDAFTLLVHSSNGWADDNLDLVRDDVIAHLSSEAETVIQRDVATADYVDLHRWLYANIGRQQGPSSLVDHQHQLAVIGDWCISGRVESAFTSGYELNLESPAA